MIVKELFNFFINEWNGKRIWIRTNNQNFNILMNKGDIKHFLRLDKAYPKYNLKTLDRIINKNKLSLKKLKSILKAKQSYNCFELKLKALCEIKDIWKSSNKNYMFDYIYYDVKKFSKAAPDLVFIKELNNGDRYILLCNIIKSSTLDNLCHVKSIMYCYLSNKRSQFNNLIKIDKTAIVKNKCCKQ